MNVIVARLKIQDGKEAEALAALEKMAKAVESEEPGTLAYAVHRVKNDPTQIVFFELYQDDESLAAHGKSPHMGDFRSAFAELFVAPETKIDQLERVGGFIRDEAS